MSDYSEYAIEDRYEQYIDLDTGIWIEEKIEDREPIEITILGREVENLRDIYTTYPIQEICTVQTSKRL